MVAIVETTKRVPPGKASRGTLAELVAKQKLLADRQAEFQGVQPIQSWTQGLAQVTGAVSTGLQQHAAEKSEAEGRQKLAEIQALVGETGATAQQLADMGMIDPEAAENYRKSAEDKHAAKLVADALVARQEDEQNFQGGQNNMNRAIDQARVTETGRSNLVNEANAAAQTAETGTHNRATEQNATATTTETGRSNRATEATAAGQLAETGTHNRATEQNAAATTTETGRSNRATEQNAAGQLAETGTHNRATEQNAAGQLAVQQDQLTLEANKPQGELDQFMQGIIDWNAQPPAIKNNPQNQAMFMAKIREMTATKKGMSFTVDKDGNISFSEGGVEEGTTNPDGSPKDLSLKAERLDAYETDARAANDVLPALDAAEKAVGAAGYTGPFQGPIGMADDILEGVGSVFGAEAGKSSIDVPFVGEVGASLPGTSSARGIIRSGNLQQTLEKVQKTIGAISNAEMDLFSRASISLENTEENNRMLIGMAKAISQRAQQRAQMAREYAARPENNGSVAGFEAKVWNPYITANPLIGSDDNGNPILLGQGPRASSVGTPQAGAPAPAGDMPDFSTMSDENVARMAKGLPPL